MLVVSTGSLGFGTSRSHVECRPEGAALLTVDLWVPAVLLNTPYGGSALGTGVMSANFSANDQGFGIGIGTTTANGSAAGAFFEANASYFVVANLTLSGPGTNSPCVSPVEVELLPPLQNGVASRTVPLPSNRTDSGEATNITILSGATDVNWTPWWNNAFGGPNSPEITTCGGSGLNYSVRSTGLALAFPWSVGGRITQVPYLLPFAQSYEYSFPPNFGTWQVDNLSAPGGPGGGWAFSYSPCT